MSQLDDLAVQHQEKIKAFSQTLSNKEDARAVLDLAAQTRCSPEQIKKLHEFCMGKGIHLSWISAELALIIFAEIQLMEMNREFLEKLDADRKAWITQSNEDEARFRDDQLEDHLKAKEELQEHFRKLFSTELELQQKTIEETKALLAQLGSENQLAKDWIAAILRDAQTELMKPLTISVAKKVDVLLDSINGSLEEVEKQAPKVANNLTLAVNTALKNSINEAAKALSDQTTTAHKNHLKEVADATKHVERLLKEVQIIKKRETWFGYLRSHVATIALFTALNVLALSLFAFFIPHKPF